MSYNVDELHETGIMDPSLAEAIKIRPFPVMPSDYIAHREARAAHLRRLRYMMPVPDPIPDQVTEREIFIPARDGYQIRVMHYTPAKSSPTPGPLIVLYHEGGWGMGDLSDETFNARLFTRDLGATCLNVEYRLVPEHPSPTGILDSWDVLKYAAENASALGADPTKGFIVGGSSAGGNFSAVLAHLSRSNNLQPPVTGQWLSVPYILPSTQIPDKYKDVFLSMTENTIDPVLGTSIDDTPGGTLESVSKFDATSSLCSVLANDIYPPTAENQAGKGPLARAFFQIAGIDPLRDHGLVYDRIMREEYGVETKVKLYPGFGHMFWTNWPEMEMSKQFTDDMLEGFRWLLNMN